MLMVSSDHYHYMFSVLRFNLVFYLVRSRMLRAILNKSWRKHPTKPQLYGHLPPITKTIQVRRTRHAGHCWRSRNELISDVLLWTPTYDWAKAGRPAQTYIQQLCEDAGCSPEDLPEPMKDREKWRERIRDIRAGGTTWWCWNIFLFFNLARTSRDLLLPGYGTKLHLMVRLQFWKPEECGILLHCHYS